MALIIMIALTNLSLYPSNYIFAAKKVEPLTAKAVWASMSDENLPENVIDQDLGTRWSAFGEGQWIALDLGEVKEVGYLGVAFYRGDQRKGLFDIELSLDNENWTSVYSGIGSGKSNRLEAHGFEAQPARYVRIVGYGAWTTDTVKTEWNSITEIHVYAPHPSGYILADLQPHPEGPDANAPVPVKAGLYSPDGTKHEPHTPTLATGKVLNVLDFGASTEDDGQDDAAAIRRAIEAADYNDVVYFPNGHYQLTSSSHDTASHLMLKSGITLRGESEQGVLLVSDYAQNYGEHTVSEGMVLRIAGMNNIHITQMTITASWDLQYPTSTTVANEFRGGPKTAILISAAQGIASSNITIDHVTVEKFQRAGIHIRQSHDVVVDHATLRNATDISDGGSGYGVSIEGKPKESRLGREDDSYFNVVRNSRFEGPYLRHGVIMQFWTHNNLVHDNYFDQIRLDAVDLHGEDEYMNEIRNNYFFGGGEAGVGVGNTGASHDAAGPGNYIHHNQFENIERYGVQVYLGSPDTVIEHNQFFGFTRKDSHAIRLKNAPGTIVRGNMIQNNLAENFWGIRVIYDIGDPGANGNGSGEPTNIAIRDNIITGNTNGVEIEAGSRIRLVDNTINNNKNIDYRNQVTHTNETEPSADVTVRKNEEISNGQSKTLIVKGGNDNSTRMTYMKFPIISDAIEDVASVELHLFGRASEADSSIEVVSNDVYAVSLSDWEEDEMLWTVERDNRPMLGEKIAEAVFQNNGEDQWYRIDVTDYVAQAIENKEDIISLAMVQPAAAKGYWTQFNSREHEQNKPFLKIEAYPLLQLEEVELYSDKKVLGIHETDQLIVTGKLNNGAAAALERAEISFESMQPNLIKVDEQGKIEALTAGETEIKVTVDLNGAVRSASLWLEAVDGKVIKLLPTDDGYVRGGTYATANYPTHGLEVKRDGSENNTRESYLRFDWSGIDSENANGLGQIKGLRLYLHGRVNAVSTDPKLQIYQTDTNWNENSLSWATKPVLLDRLAEAVLPSEADWTAVQITDGAPLGHMSAALGLALIGEQLNDYFVLDSKERTNAPYLLIILSNDDLTGPGGPGPGTNPDLGSGNGTNLSEETNSKKQWLKINEQQYELRLSYNEIMELAASGADIAIELEGWLVSTTEIIKMLAGRMNTEIDTKSLSYDDDVRIQLKVHSRASKNIINSLAQKQYESFVKIVSPFLEWSVYIGNQKQITALDNNKEKFALRLKPVKEINTVRARTGLYRFDSDKQQLVYEGNQKLNDYWTAEASLDGGGYGLMELTPLYDDVTNQHWAYEAIAALNAQHMLKGISRGEFAPDERMTRGQMAVLLDKYLNLSDEITFNSVPLVYKDLDKKDFYYDAAMRVAEAGLLLGKGDGRFDPSGSLTREQLAVLLVRLRQFENNYPANLEDYALQSTVNEQVQNLFADAEDFSNWAADSIKLAAANGWLKGYPSGVFKPAKMLSRAETAQAFYTFITM